MIVIEYIFLVKILKSTFTLQQVIPDFDDFIIKINVTINEEIKTTSESTDQILVFDGGIIQDLLRTRLFQVQ